MSAPRKPTSTSKTPWCASPRLESSKRATASNATEQASSARFAFQILRCLHSEGPQGRNFKERKLRYALLSGPCERGRSVSGRCRGGRRLRSTCLLVARKRLSLPQENREFLLGHFPADATGAIVQPALQQIELAPASALLLLKDLFEVGLLDGGELRDVHAGDLGVGLFGRAKLDLISRRRVAGWMEVPDLCGSARA